MDWTISCGFPAQHCVAIPTPAAIESVFHLLAALRLQAWQVHTADRIYIFPHMLKDDHLEKDMLITDDGLYK